MDFEYDPDESEVNRQKHGIDFEEPQALWDDPNRVEIPAKVTDEPRFLVIGNDRRQALVCRHDLSK